MDSLSSQLGDGGGSGAVELAVFDLLWVAGFGAVVSR